MSSHRFLPYNVLGKKENIFRKINFQKNIFYMEESYNSPRNGVPNLYLNLAYNNLKKQDGP
jgi:hypothetical protein